MVGQYIKASVWDFPVMTSHSVIKWYILFSREKISYMLLAGWEVRIRKNCDRGFENAARGDFQAWGHSFSLYGPILSIAQYALTNHSPSLVIHVQYTKIGLFVWSAWRLDPHHREPRPVKWSYMNPSSLLPESASMSLYKTLSDLKVGFTVKFLQSPTNALCVNK